MKHKRKNSQHRIWRKNVDAIHSVGEWSRMLHSWWMKDVVEKLRFKKGKNEEE